MSPRSAWWWSAAASSRPLPALLALRTPLRVPGGPKERTDVELNKVTLAKNVRDKVVSKKVSTTGMRAHKHIQTWTRSVKTARKANKVAPSEKKTSSPKLHRGV